MEELLIVFAILLVLLILISTFGGSVTVVQAPAAKKTDVSTSLNTFVTKEEEPYEEYKQSELVREDASYSPSSASSMSQQVVITDDNGNEVAEGQGHGQGNEVAEGNGHGNEVAEGHGNGQGNGNEVTDNDNVTEGYASCQTTEGYATDVPDDHTLPEHDVSVEGFDGASWAVV
jgi:hypothetical protein